MKLGKNVRLFKRTTDLETQIDQFLDSLSESAIVFKSAVNVYLDDGCTDEFTEKHEHVDRLESKADDLRRAIEIQLYTQTLIPESRGDVLGLMENLDNIINLIEGVLWAFHIELPQIPEDCKDGYRKLTEMSTESVEAVVLASRAFFRNIEAVGDHNHKVIYYETEADKASTRLKMKIFGSEIGLGHKMHLRGFVENIDDIADWAEDVADRLTIYVIKRTV
ncbi:MAG: DUF47 family protein [Alphaproteobacteria bacterium]|nr:DUF47 family protein [Alphaproteobacteria bacterium]